MKFETKFELGQKVHVFGRTHRELFDPCPVCGGRGRVNFDRADGSGSGDTYCPNNECRRGRIKSVWYDLWEYAGTAKVGRVEITAYDPELAPRWQEKLYEERYMLDTTGIGSGTLYTFDGAGWTHTHLFATKGEGEAWAAEVNEPLRAEAEEKRERTRISEAEAVA